MEAQTPRVAQAPPGTEEPTGPVAAVMLATGIGAVVLGVLVVLAEASTGIADFLQFSDRVGPLSGKTIFAAASFFVSWGVLDRALRDKDTDLRRVTIIMVAMLALALVLTFPPFFQLFAAEE